MEHLKNTFHLALADPAEELVRFEDGRVHIHDGHWSPQDLLFAMGPDAYEKEFRSWLANHRDQLIERANELLEQYDQAERFDKLKEIYKSDSVVPFVGAGMSMPSNYPSWTGFLKKLRTRTAIDEAVLQEMLDRGEYEEAAQTLADALGQARFDEQVENTFGAERPSDGPVQLLPYLFKRFAITTNFDNVLKRCYDAANCSFSETLLGTQAQEFPRVLAAGRPFLTKLHGSATSGFNRVLTKREYDHAYADPQTLQRVIKTLCSRTLLFVGCSLTVDRLLSCMRDYIKAEGVGTVARHYAFVSAPETDAERHEREAKLAEFNIYPIWYAKGEDSWEIEALLQLLADGVVQW
jgi:SIR2-like domain